jgi:hypothetical protein
MIIIYCLLIKRLKMIIGLVGNEHVGKDTIANYLCKIYNFRKYSLANPIKEIARIIFGWNQTQLNGKLKDNTDNIIGIVPREFFKWLGTDVFQYMIHEKFPELNIKDRCIWANCMKQFIEIYSNNSHIVIPDIRFKHEADELLKAGGYLIYINRDSTFSDNYEILDLINKINPSTDKPWIFDIIDNNSGYDELYANINNIINKIKRININIMNSENDE